MDAAVNRLIHQYRTLRLKEWDIELQEIALHRGIEGLSKAQFMEYADATQGIDAAMSDCQEQIDASHWAFSTARQRMHMAANSTGQDMGVRR